MTVADSTLLGRPLWYELMTTDMKAAETFYRTVIGWTTVPFEGSPDPYAMFNRSGEVSVAGLMARPDGMDVPPFWAMYVGVPKLEDAASHVKRLGGAEVSPVIDVPTIGRMQMIKDPQGAMFYIYEPVSADQLPEAAPEVGEASWHELYTTDTDAALTFYREVFGWIPTEAMDMGPMGKYQMFGRHLGSIGGMMKKPPELAQAPPFWSIYFRVPDITAATERIKANGGQVTNGPMEVPSGDWIVNGMDPQGAPFSLHQKKAAN